MRDEPGRFDNRWAAEMTGDGPSLDLTWDKPQRIRQVQITFDSGFHRELTLSASDSANRGVIRAPQPETVRDYALLYRKPGSDKWSELVSEEGNHRRLRRHEFEPVDAGTIPLHVRRTNGNNLARVFKVRCYA